MKLPSALRTDLISSHRHEQGGRSRVGQFTGADPTGLDNYELKSGTYTVRFAIYLGTDGKIVATNFGPPQPQHDGDPDSLRGLDRGPAPQPIGWT
jgi:hypothetical protein